MRLVRDDYTVGWICALPLEMAAATLMLDEKHENLPMPLNDNNAYVLGSIGKHNVVIACLPRGVYGTTSATAVAMQLLSSFNSIRFGLIVGIGGGVPSRNADIRLGDVVVSQPTDLYGGVVQYDLGKTLGYGQFLRTGMLNQPPEVLLTALSNLQAKHLAEESQLVEFLSDLAIKAGGKASNFARPNRVDHLYQADYNHAGSNTCEHCDQSKLVLRPPRARNVPVIHYGLIASANQVMRDGRERDQLAKELGVYCVEMEAAGLMNNFPCLVIRGICDYADSHKNKDWQGYAAAVAAAYTKELLLVVPFHCLDGAPTARHALSDSIKYTRIQLDLNAVPAIEGFVGLQKELDCMWRYLQPASSQTRKVAILHGLGGMGKTQLAIRFARVHKNDYLAVFWLKGRDRSMLLQSLSSVAARLPGTTQTVRTTNEKEVEQDAKQALKWLAMEENSNWLLIFDDIEQYSTVRGSNNGYDITEFFPAADHGSIIITTRDRALLHLGKSFPVVRLDSDEALQLLLRSCSFSASDHSSHMHVDATRNISERLGGLPLAVVIAGAFIRETGTSLSAYLEFYEQCWFDLQCQSSPGHQYPQGNIAQTWMISYQEVQKRNPSAAELLVFLAYFDNQDIWYDLVKNGYQSSARPKWFDKVVSTRLAFSMTMKTLVGFSLIETKQQEGSYTIHPVVQDWCIHALGANHNININRLKLTALASVGYMVPTRNDKAYWELERRLLPHANKVLGILGGMSLSEDDAVFGAIHRLGSLFRHQGKFKNAEKMYEQALRGKTKLLGPYHADTLTTINSLGNLYADQGKLEEARDMYQQALEGREHVSGPDHTDTLMTVNNMGNLYADQGKLKEAEEMYQRALTGYEKTLNPGHMSILLTVNNLGNLYAEQGKLKEAEEMYQQALVGYEATLGLSHTSTLLTVNNLGNLYRDQGKLNEAGQMYQRALIGYENTLGPDHTDTLMTVNNLGLLFANQGKLKEAEEMYQRALVGYEKVLGPDHTVTLHPVNNLGNLYRDQHRLKDAEEMYQRAFKGREKALGPDHTATLDSVHCLGLLYADQGKMREAEEFYHQALAGYEKVLGLDHESTCLIVNNLGNLYADWGKLDKAKEMYQRAVAGYKKLFGLNHKDTQDIIYNLGLLYGN